MLATWQHSSVHDDTRLENTITWLCFIVHWGNCYWWVWWRGCRARLFPSHLRFIIWRFWSPMVKAFFRNPSCGWVNWPCFYRPWLLPIVTIVCCVSVTRNWRHGHGHRHGHGVDVRLICCLTKSKTHSCILLQPYILAHAFEICSLLVQCLTIRLCLPLTKAVHCNGCVWFTFGRLVLGDCVLTMLTCQVGELSESWGGRGTIILQVSNAWGGWLTGMRRAAAVVQAAWLCARVAWLNIPWDAWCECEAVTQMTDWTCGACYILLITMRALFWMC